MPWPNPFGTSAAGGGKPEVTFAGPILLGKLKEPGVFTGGPLNTPSGSMYVQSTGAITNQVVSTAAPGRASFPYIPISTATLIGGGSTGAPPYQGYGSALAFINQPGDQHLEMWSTNDNEWIRFGAVSNVPNSTSTQTGPFSTGVASTVTIITTGSPFSLIGVWPQIAVFGSSGNEIRGYTDFTWNETSEIFLQNQTTGAAITGSGVHLNIASLGGFNVFSATTASGGGIINAVAIGDTITITDASDTYVIGQSNQVGGGGPAYVMGRGNFITTSDGGTSINYIYGDLNEIRSTGGNNYIYGNNNVHRGDGNSNMTFGQGITMTGTGGANLIIGNSLIISTSDEGFNAALDRTTVIVISSGAPGAASSGIDGAAFLAKPTVETYLYNQSSSGTAFGKATITITSSSAQVVLKAASTAELVGGTLGLYSAGSAGSTGTATVRFLSATSGSTQALPARFYESTGGNYVGIMAPSTMPAASYTVTLPASAPSTGQFLQVDSSHVTKWAHPSAVSQQFQTASGATVTVLNGVITAIV